MKKKVELKMIVHRLHFKWNKKLEYGKFKLGDFASKEEIEKELIKVIDKENWFEIKGIENVKIEIDPTGIIRRKLFTKNSKMGEFEITLKSIKDVKEEFEPKLEICEKEYSGDKLILVLWDALLHSALLIRDKMEN